MIHLVIREPVEYQKTLCQALEKAYDGNFVAWFAGKRIATLSDSSETYVSRFLPHVGYRRMFRELKADTQPIVILGGWSSTFAWVTLLITAALRVPVFIWADHPLPRQRRNLLRLVYLKLLNRRVAGVLACGKPTVDHLATIGFDREKITNFPYWVRVPEAWSLPDREANQPEAPIRLLTVGRLVSVKGFDVAIRAVAAANEKPDQPIATLEVIGEGIERQQLEALALTLGMQRSITFSGLLSNDEVCRRMAESDALIVPSSFEPYGVVVLEALAQGRLVLASDRVIAALDRDNKKGAILFHSVGDSVALAQQLTMLAGNRNILREGAHAAREIAEQWKPERAALILNSAIQAAQKTKSANVIESGFGLDQS
jgi:glycosyltransferase involved in cell wall biosynthesis